MVDDDLLPPGSATSRAPDLVAIVRAQARSAGLSVTFTRMTRREWPDATIMIASRT